MAEPAQSNIQQTQGTQANDIEAQRAAIVDAGNRANADAQEVKDTQTRLGYESDAANAYSRARTVDEQIKVIKDYFKEFATNVSEQKINTLMPIIKREVDELGLSKYENPFIDFIEKYLPNNEMTVAEYTALHNLYSQAVVDEEDVRGTYNKGNQEEKTNTPLFNPDFYKHAYTDMILYWNVWKNFRKPNEVKKQLRDNAVLQTSAKDKIEDVKNYFDKTKKDNYKAIRDIILFAITESEAAVSRQNVRGLKFRPVQVVQTLLSQIITRSPRATDYRDSDDEEEDKRNRDDGSFYAVGSIDNVMQGIDKLYQTNKNKIKNLYKYIVTAIDEIANNDFSIRTKETEEYRQMVDQNSTKRFPEITAKIKSKLIQADYIKSSNYQRVTKEVIARYSPLADKKVKEEEGANQ